jgi:hypothetical protein
VAATRDKTAAYQNGTYTPATPSECLELVGWCQVNQLHRTAAGLYAAAFAGAAGLADDLKAAHRYHAVCHAAFAAAGAGNDAAQLDDPERARLRQQAVAWLRADLALHTKHLMTDRAAVQQVLTHWQQNPALAGLRDPAALAKLPAEERKTCTQLWADVAELRTRAEEKPR